DALWTSTPTCAASPGSRRSGSLDFRTTVSFRVLVCAMAGTSGVGRACHLRKSALRTAPRPACYLLNPFHPPPHPPIRSSRYDSRGWGYRKLPPPAVIVAEPGCPAASGRQVTRLPSRGALLARPTQRPRVLYPDSGTSNFLTSVLPSPLKSPASTFIAS